MVAAPQRTAAQDASFALSVELSKRSNRPTRSARRPLYNFASSAQDGQGWVDHIIATGRPSPTRPTVPAARRHRL